MFGRDKAENGPRRTGSTLFRKGETPAPVIESPVVERPGAKNRPTPSRREAQAARLRPVVPADREAAKKESRVKEREERARTRDAMFRGEEWALGVRDRGEQRRFARDMVDGRFNVGEFLMPVMIIALPLSLMPNKYAYIIAFAVLYGMLAATIVDVALLIRRVKKAIRTRFGQEPQRGTGWYVMSRSVQLRAGRMPKPQVTRKGEPIGDVRTAAPRR